MPENKKENGEISRREFLKAAGLFVVGAAVVSTVPLSGCGFPNAPEIDANAYSIEGDTVTIALERVPALSKVGGSAAIVNDSERIYLIVARTGEEEYAVASNRCTHRGKPVGYAHEGELFICTSGKSEFTLDGAIVKGPAEKPLRIYSSHLQQGSLTIELES